MKFTGTAQPGRAEKGTAQLECAQKERIPPDHAIANKVTESPTTNFSVLISYVEAFRSLDRVKLACSRAVLGTDFLSGQVQIRRKIASYLLFAKVGESISLSQGLGTKERAIINHISRSYEFREQPKLGQWMPMSYIFNQNINITSSKSSFQGMTWLLPLKTWEKEMPSPTSNYTL